MAPTSLNRRRFFEVSGAAGVAAFIAACGGDEGTTTTSQSGQSASLAQTPPCDDGHTPPQTEGPYFKPSSPERTDLRAAGDAGAPLALAGRVLSTECEPIAGALLDFWQADGDGAYDNAGFRLRGHQFADERGRFELLTVKPGLYSGRTRHIHVMVQPEDGEVLTTQLYFPGEPENESDVLFDERLLIALSGDRGSFDFVVEA